MKKAIAVGFLALALTGCGRDATIHVDPGYSGPQPDVKCEVIIPGNEAKPTDHKDQSN